MSIEKLLAELNPAQHQAATTNAQNTLVLAGAGSGKTKTIVARAAYLISQGIPADQIQIVTFTRRAASEIVTRVESYLSSNGGIQAEGLKAATFHTFCLSILRRYPKVFDLQGFNVIDRDDQVMMFRLLRSQYEDKIKAENAKKQATSGKPLTFDSHKKLKAQISTEHASVGQFPHMKAQDSFEEVEEERRVLYVALTRAKDELIITRQNQNTWTSSRVDSEGRTIEGYFLSDVPKHLLNNDAYAFQTSQTPNWGGRSAGFKKPKIGISFGGDESF